MPKSRPISKKKRTSQGYRVSVLKRVGRLARYKLREEVEAFVGSDYFATAIGGMTAYDRVVAINGICKYVGQLDAIAPIPKAPRFSAPRLKWGPEEQARMRAIATRYGMRPGLDHEIAREMGRPLAACLVARHTYLGRIRGPQGGRKPRARGTHGGRERGPHPSTFANQTPTSRYVSQAP